MDNSVLVSGLVFTCPIKKDSQSCPFHEIRKMEIIKKLDYIKKLPNNELTMLITHHKNCLAIFEK